MDLDSNLDINIRSPQMPIKKTMKQMSLFQTKSKSSIEVNTRKYKTSSISSKFLTFESSRANTRAEFTLPISKTLDNLEEDEVDCPSENEIGVFKRDETEQKVILKQKRPKEKKNEINEKRVILFDQPCFYQMKLNKNNEYDFQDFLERFEIFNYKTNSNFDPKILRRECFPPNEEEVTFTDFLVFRLVENKLLKYAYKKYRENYKRKAELFELLDLYHKNGKNMDNFSKVKI